MSGIVRHRGPRQLAVLAVSLVMLLSCSILGPKYEEVQLTPDEERIGALMQNLLVGEMYGRQGDTGNAGDHYLRASQLSQDPEIAARAVQIALWDKNYDLMEEAASRWLQLRPDDPHPSRALGASYALRGRIDEAVEAYDRAIRKDSLPDGGVQAIHQSLSVPGMDEVRLPVLRQLAARQPENVAAGYHHARTAYQAGELEEARGAIRTVVSRQPGWSLAVVLEFDILRSAGYTDEALGRLHVSLEQPLQNPLRVRQILADTLLQEQRYTEARAQYHRLIDVDAANPNWRFALGIIAILEQNWTRVREHFSILHDLQRPLRPQQSPDLNRSVASYFLGLVEEQEGDTERALDLYAEVKEWDYLGLFGTEDYYQRARLRSSDLLLRHRDLQAARQFLAQSRADSRKEDNVVLFYASEATLLQEEGDHAASKELLTEALTYYPGNEQLLYQRALLFGTMGRHDDLERDLVDLLEKQPDHPHALNALGYTWADLDRNLEKALEYIQKAHEQLPEDAAILDSLGWVYYRLGQLERAEELLRKAYALRAGDGEILAHLIEVVWARGNHGEARRMYRQAVEQLPRSRFLDQLAGRFEL